MLKILAPDGKLHACHFCGATKSVKYTVEIHDPILGQGMSTVCCCNKCALFFIGNQPAAKK